MDEKKWLWLIKFLLTDDPDKDPNDLEIYMLDGQRQAVQDQCVLFMRLLHPKHRDAMLAYYQSGQERDPMIAQNIFHGRMALWAALRWPGNEGLELLRELVH